MWRWLKLLTGCSPEATSTPSPTPFEPTSVFRSSVSDVPQRYVEPYFTPTFFETVGEDLTAHIRQQIREDELNEEFIPRLSRIDKKFEVTPFGIIRLGSVIHSGAYSVIYNAANSFKGDSVVVKYQINCDDTLHELIPDFHYTRISSSLGVSPRVFFLSPPVLANRAALIHPKLEFKRTSDQDESVEECINGSHGWRPTIRYMVMEKKGESLMHYVRKREFEFLPFITAIEIIRDVFRALHTLHSIGIVHGDIHAGNIVISEELGDGIERRIDLIDFGRAFTESSIRPQVMAYKPYTFRGIMASHWQLVGLPWGPRDDAMRCLIVLANITNPLFSWYYSTEIRGMTNKGAKRDFTWKSQKNIFVTTDSTGETFDPTESLVSDIGEESVESIRIYLNEILFHVRGLGNATDVPDYDFIIEKLSSILCLALHAAAECVVN